MESAGNEPKRISVKPVRPVKSQKITNRELWATVCYHYPQYTLEDAKKLSVRDIKLLLRVADKKEAERFLQLTQIVASPHTKKGQGVKQLTNYYKKQIGN